MTVQVWVCTPFEMNKKRKEIQRTWTHITCNGFTELWLTTVNLEISSAFVSVTTPIDLIAPTHYFVCSCCVTSQSMIGIGHQKLLVSRYKKEKKNIHKEKFKGLHLVNSYLYIYRFTERWFPHLLTWLAHCFKHPHCDGPVNDYSKQSENLWSNKKKINKIKQTKQKKKNKDEQNRHMSLTSRFDIKHIHLPNVLSHRTVKKNCNNLFSALSTLSDLFFQK